MEKEDLYEKYKVYVKAIEEKNAVQKQEGRIKVTHDIREEEYSPVLDKDSIIRSRLEGKEIQIVYWDHNDEHGIMISLMSLGIRIYYYPDGVHNIGKDSATASLEFNSAQKEELFYRYFDQEEIDQISKMWDDGVHDIEEFIQGIMEITKNNEVVQKHLEESKEDIEYIKQQIEK